MPLFRNYADGGITTTETMGRRARGQEGGGGRSNPLLSLFKASFLGGRFDILFSEGGA